MSKETYYDTNGIFVNRHTFTAKRWIDYYNDDGVIVGEAISFTPIAHYEVEYDCWLYPDGSLDLCKYNRLIYDYIKK